MNPASNDSVYLRDSNAAVYQAINQSDPTGIYIMQAWLFHAPFWNSQTVEAYLSGVPNDKTIILDLNTEEDPVWNMFDGFYGKPWIWNMLTVYGGRRGLYGNLSRIATGPLTDLRTANSTMVGIGTTPGMVTGTHIEHDMATSVRGEPSALPVRVVPRM
jgi:alpha-N-acetylglucosaminidase